MHPVITMADVEAMDVEQPEPTKGKGRKARGDRSEDGDTKGKSKSGKRFEIKKWSAVAMWSWAICTDTCAICRNNLYEPSIEYQVKLQPCLAVWLREAVHLSAQTLPDLCLVH